MSKLITLDFETYYDSNVGFAKQTTEEYINDPRFEPLIVSMRLPDGTLVTQDLYDMTKPQGREFFLDHGLSECAMLAQNTMFDGAILNWYYGVRPKRYVDTMLIARMAVRHRTGSTSLATLAQYFGIGEKGTNVIAAKGRRRQDFTDEEWQDYREYCEHDVALTYALFVLMAPMIPPKELATIHTTLRWYIEPTFELDMPMLRAAVYNEQVETQGHLKIAGVDLETLSSNKKFAEWLTAMGVNVPTKISLSTGKPIPAIAKSDKQFQALQDHPNPTIVAAVKARLNAKSRIKETRMERFIGIGERCNGKLPVPLLYAGAHTQRYAGMEQINLQNLTTGDAMRGSIKAPEGFSLVSADQGQIECRLNACLSGQDDLLEAFRDGEDVYSDMATAIYRVPITEETAPLERKVGKAIVLGAGYGMGGERCYDYLTGQWRIPDVSKEFAYTCVYTYRTKYWRVAQNWKDVDQLLQIVAYGGEQQYGPVTFSHEKVTLPSGVALHFPDMQHDGENYQYRRYDRKSRKWVWVKIYGAMMVENICQALARELLNDQMLTLDKRWKSVHQIHDEVIFVVPDQEVDLACKVMKKIMEISPDWMPNLPLRVQPTAGKTLGECK